MSMKAKGLASGELRRDAARPILWIGTGGKRAENLNPAVESKKAQGDIAEPGSRLV